MPREVEEELMPELVALVLSHVDRVSLVASRFVCATWKRASASLPPFGEAHHQQLEEQKQEDYSQQVAARGWLALLQWARANGCPWDESTCAKAAEGGQLEVLRWARANGCPWDASTCMWAAEGGHLEVLQWARANGCVWDASTCMLAAEGGHLEVLQWARTNG
jgi:hypothetical protein